MNSMGSNESLHVFTARMLSDDDGFIHWIWNVILDIDGNDAFGSGYKVTRHFYERFHGAP